MLYIILATVILVVLFFRFIRSQPQQRVPSKNRAVLVTGAASGIGRAAALRLAAMGCHVYAVDLKKSAVESALAELDPSCFTAMECNVTVPQQIDAVFQIVKSTGRGLYGVVNSAGISHGPNEMSQPTKILAGIEVDPVDVAAVMDVNYLGTVRMNHAAFPLLIKDGGCIVNIASVAGLIGLYGMSAYCASKHAVVGYSDAIRRELRPYGVDVCCVMPGFTHTPMIDRIARTARAAEFDYSGTMLKKGRGDEGLMVSLDGAQLTTPDSVAADICSALFSSPVPQRVFSDIWFKKLVWEILTKLPVSAQDYLLEKLESTYGKAR